MTVHMYEDRTKQRSWLIHEVKPEPGQNPRFDDSLYWPVLNLGGFLPDGHGGSHPNPDGPFVLRFDDALPHEAEAHGYLLERMQMRDKRGQPLIPEGTLVPFSPVVQVREADLDLEVQRRVQQAEMEKPEEMGEFPLDRPVPAGRWRCPACAKVYKTNGAKGHMQFSIKWGMDIEGHELALMEYEASREKVPA